MYLKVPRMMPGLKERAVELDGSINFIGNASRDTRLSNATLTLRPVVGDESLLALQAISTQRCWRIFPNGTIYALRVISHELPRFTLLAKRARLMRHES